MILLPLFQLPVRLNSQNPYETEIHNELWHTNLYMSIGISSWHVCCLDPTKMSFFNFISVRFTITDNQTP